MDNVYEKTKEMLHDELEELTKSGNLSPSDVKMVDTLLHSIKNACKIMESEDEGYSQDGGWRAEGNYSRGRYSRNDGNYSRDNSYANRGMHYVRGHYSRDDGMDMISERMESMMSDRSMSPADRETLQRAMDLMRK